MQYTNLETVKFCAFSIVDVWIPVKFEYYSHIDEPHSMSWNMTN